MTDFQRERAEEVKKYGLDTMLDALAMYCSGDNCKDCWYINKTDDSCEVFNYIEKYDLFPFAAEVSCRERVE